VSIPEFRFDDEAKGLPPHPVPVRYACLAADWSPALLADILAKRAPFGKSLTVWNYDEASGRVGEVLPNTYPIFAPEKQNDLKLLPANHFIWSDDLVKAYSEYIDQTLDRDDARELGMGIRWRPASSLNNDAIKECHDLSTLIEEYSENNFIRYNNNIWTINYSNHQENIPDRIGIHYIKILLMSPTSEFSSRDLQIQVNPPPSLPGIDIQGLMPTEDEENSGFSIGGLTDAGENLDSQAIEEFKTRLRRIKSEIEDARDRGDEEKQLTLEEEEDKITNYLIANLKKSGRSRVSGSTDEKVRKSIYKAISDAIKHISKFHPEMGQHLTESIQTGSYCSYIPPAETNWQR